MNDKILQKIVDFAAQELQNAYGYCGVASGDSAAMINSTDKDGNEIKIVIESSPD